MADREKLIELIAKFLGGLTINDVTPPYGYENLADHLIANGVTVRKRGRWEQIGFDKAMDRITCSCCGEYFNILDNNTEDFNFCPNCGADMREPQEET